MISIPKYIIFFTIPKTFQTKSLVLANTKTTNNIENVGAKIDRERERERPKKCARKTNTKQTTFSMRGFKYGIPINNRMRYDY